MHDPTILFETRFPEPEFRGFRDELDAVAGGRKAISIVLFRQADIDVRDSDYLEYVTHASRIGLSVQHHRRSFDIDTEVFQHTYVSASLPAHAWRLSAYAILLESAYQCGWSDCAEVSCSLLLGYSREMAVDWLSRAKHACISWGLVDIYLLANQTQYECIRTTNGRFFPVDIPGDLTLFSSFGRLPIRRDALTLLPGDRFLCRIGLSRDAIEALLGDEPRSQMIVMKANCKQLMEIGCHAESRIEVLCATGWSKIER